MTDDPRRTLPSVQSVLELSGVQQLLDQAPRDLLVGAVRDAIELARRQPARTPRAPNEWRAAVSAALDVAWTPGAKAAYRPPTRNRASDIRSTMVNRRRSGLGGPLGAFNRGSPSRRTRLEGAVMASPMSRQSVMRGGCEAGLYRSR